MNPEHGPNPNGVRADPQLVFGISVLVALAISWPGLAGAMRGSADIMTVGVRFLIAVAVVWSALFCVASLIAGFATTSARETDMPGPVGLAEVPGFARSTTANPPLTPPVLELDPAQAAAAAQIAAATETAAG